MFLHWLPWVLRMSRPCDKNEDGQRKPAAGPAANSKQIKDIEMKERSSRSLLANVLDIDDDFRQHSCTLSSVGSGMALSMGVPTGFPRVVSTPSGGLGQNQGKIFMRIRVIFLLLMIETAFQQARQVGRHCWMRGTIVLIVNTLASTPMSLRGNFSRRTLINVFLILDYRSRRDHIAAQLLRFSP